MKYIVYMTICTANNKIYVGVHKIENLEEFDGYIGNGVNINVPSSYKKSKTPFQYAVNKYGVNKFKRIIIKSFDNKEAAFLLEASIVDEEFIRRKDTYNIKIGGSGGCATQRLKHIYMYNLEGDFVKEFKSAYECSKYLNPDSKNGSAVLKAMRTGQILHNMQFSLEKLPYMKKYTPKFGSTKYKIRVGMYNDGGILIKEYDSILACRKDGYNNVAKAIKNNIKCHGYYFKKI